MQILRYVTLSIAGLLAGAIAGCICGLALGWLLAFGYHRHGPSDPGDAPVYVAMGLMLVGACVGAITGFVIAVVYGVRLARRRKLADALQNQ
jgi:ABC-type antimicrobial peptide transport system permease subunit